MNRHRLIAALAFGIAAHLVLPIFDWLISSHPSPTLSIGNTGRLILSPFSAILLSGAIWGYLLGHRICECYAHQTKGWVKSLGVGVAIPALASATLGLMITFVGIFDGSLNLWILLMPLASVLAISVFTLGGIYIIGGLTALMLHLVCYAFHPAQPETRSLKAFSDNLT